MSSISYSPASRWIRSPPWTPARRCSWTTVIPRSFASSAASASTTDTSTDDRFRPAGAGQRHLPSRGIPDLPAIVGRAARPLFALVPREKVASVKRHAHHGSGDGGHDQHEHDHDEHDHGHGGGRWQRFGHQVTHLVRPHSHDSADKVDTALESSRAGLRALWISLAVLGVTAAMQALIFVVSGSVALLGDPLHNVADALTAVPLGIAFILGRRAAPRAYTYGF